MKKCTHCGKEYPDEKLVCDVDAWPLVSSKKAKVMYLAQALKALGGLALFNAGIFTLAYMTDWAKQFADLYPIMPLCIKTFAVVGVGGLVLADLLRSMVNSARKELFVALIIGIVGVVLAVITYFISAHFNNAAYP